jgi:hypothetical protein
MRHDLDPGSLEAAYGVGDRVQQLDHEDAGAGSRHERDPERTVPVRRHDGTP